MNTSPARDDSDTEDLEHVRDFLAGKPRAFEALFDKYRERIFGVAYRFLRHKEDALEVTQEVFLRAYQGLPRFKTDSKFFTWLYRIAVNKSIDHLRSRKARPTVELYAAADDDGSGSRDTIADPQSPDPARLAERRELAARLLAAVDQLSEKHRAVFLLHAVEELSYKEIAEVVHCSIGTVMSRLFYARKKLQQAMEQVLGSG